MTVAYAHPSFQVWMDPLTGAFVYSPIYAQDATPTLVTQYHSDGGVGQFAGSFFTTSGGIQGTFNAYTLNYGPVTAFVAYDFSLPVINSGFYISQALDGADYFDLSDFGDQVFALGGDDIVLGYGGNDNLYAGDGNDTVYGGSGSDLIEGGLGRDYLDGGSSDDYVFGGSDDDTILGGAGNDTLLGDAGNDIIYADQGADAVLGGAGNDQIYSWAGIATIALGEAGSDILYTGSGSDYLAGGADNDTIFAGGGADFVNGGAGADWLAGGQGNDYFYGEAGTDVFSLISDVYAGNFDYIGDFKTGGTADYIALDAAYAGYVSYFQYGTDVVGLVATGSSYYSFYVDGPAPITVAEVQAATFFI